MTDTGTAGPRLRLARQARGFSQQQLAGMAGVSRQAVSAVEAGHSDPSLRVAFALAQALGMTVEEVFGPADLAPPVPAAVTRLAQGLLDEETGTVTDPLAPDREAAEATTAAPAAAATAPTPEGSA